MKKKTEKEIQKLLILFQKKSILSKNKSGLIKSLIRSIGNVINKEKIHTKPAKITCPKCCEEQLLYE